MQKISTVGSKLINIISNKKQWNKKDISTISIEI